MKIAGNVFIVTGATFGIGEAVCAELAARGARLVLAGRNEAQGAAVVAKLAAATGRPDDFVFVRTDLGVLDDVRALVAATTARFGGFDGLINNAGMMGIYLRDVLKDDDSWLKTLQVNLTGALLASRLALTHFIRAGKPGVVISTGSMSQFRGHEDPIYVLTKAALASFAASIASFGEMKGPMERYKNVRAVNIAVGNTFTPIWEVSSGGKLKTQEDVDRAFRDSIGAAGGWTPMDKVVGCFVRAIEDDSMNGDTLVVSGSLPVQRTRALQTQGEWDAMMGRKETALL
ncbi:hypothetical protein DFJ74DRAFT_456891 [Hyaloraphidium curvatum]|nr:hypothetical protein DFJ74DRAFT_456891 [Hyaloraphidium curvatum]